ncbi:MAG: hypothetical protein ACAH07_02345 [Methylophilaceae bacterium]|nr:hypothetical protein [Methyloradius sp.]
MSDMFLNAMRLGSFGKDSINTIIINGWISQPIFEHLAFRGMINEFSDQFYFFIKG